MAHSVIRIIIFRLLIKLTLRLMLILMILINMFYSDQRYKYIKMEVLKALEENMGI